MANPATREELVKYAKRQLGAPVLEVNVADEQVEDLMDDAIQRFQDRHMDGVEKMYLKHKITKNWLDSLQATSFPGAETSTGLTSTTSASVNITGIGATTFSFEETQRGITSGQFVAWYKDCLLYTSPSPRDVSTSRMPSSA